MLAVNTFLLKNVFIFGLRSQFD